MIIVFSAYYLNFDSFLAINIVEFLCLFFLIPIPSSKNLILPTPGINSTPNFYIFPQIHKNAPSFGDILSDNTHLLIKIIWIFCHFKNFQDLSYLVDFLIHFNLNFLAKNSTSILFLNFLLIIPFIIVITNLPRSLMKTIVLIIVVNFKVIIKKFIIKSILLHHPQPLHCTIHSEVIKFTIIHLLLITTTHYHCHSKCLRS